MYTKDNLTNDIIKMGILPTDTVVIHTSLKAIGEVSGGAITVLEAFKSYLSNGLFIIPTHTWENVNKENPVFNVKETLPCIGILPTMAVNYPNGYRSLHPTHSVVAFGTNAKKYIAGEELTTTPTSKGGCWGRLFDMNAKILLIGVTHNRNTYLHAVDEIIGVENRLSSVPEMYTVIDNNSNNYQVTQHRHSCSAGDVSANYDNYEPAFIYHKAMELAKFGDATVRICFAHTIATVAKLIWSNADYDVCLEKKAIPDKFYK